MLSTRRQLLQSVLDDQQSKAFPFTEKKKIFKTNDRINFCDGPCFVCFTCIYQDDFAMINVKIKISNVKSKPNNKNQNF